MLYEVITNRERIAHLIRHHAIKILFKAEVVHKLQTAARYCKP